jgi:hypothetical protein
MIKRNGPNERVKRRYLQYLKEVKGRDEASLDAVAKAIDRFEDHAKNRDFKKFHIEQARAFKAHLASTRNARTGDPLSASTEDLPYDQAGPRVARRHAGGKRNRTLRSGAHRFRASLGRARSGDRLVQIEAYRGRE